MKLPEDRICPNGWPNCEDCKYDRGCKPGRYHIETDLEVVIRAAEVSDRVTQGEAVESVARIKGTWADHFLKMDETERWEDYRRYHVADLISKQPIPLDGPSSPGGGRHEGSQEIKQRMQAYDLRVGNVQIVKRNTVDIN